jgi:hypothetical protein
VYFPLQNVPMTVGALYSFELQAATARYGVYWPSMENYDGGNAIFFGAPIDADLHFAVLGAVPEPFAGALLLAGVPLLLLMTRQRNARALQAVGRNTADSSLHICNTESHANLPH